MKHFENKPLVLLISYLILCAFRTPNIADALIALGLCGLFGFRLFTEYKPRKDISEQLESQKLQIYQEMHHMKSEILNEVGKITMGRVASTMSELKIPKQFKF